MTRMARSRKVSFLNWLLATGSRESSNRAIFKLHGLKSNQLVQISRNPQFALRESRKDDGLQEKPIGLV